jgi:WD40 repeat protein
MVSASRDRTLGVWSFHSSQHPSHLSHDSRLATLVGHRASVVCFKFNSSSSAAGKPKDKVADWGFLVSGSSDGCIFIWDLSILDERDHDSDYNVAGEDRMPGLGRIIRPIKELKAHDGGVLDLKLDESHIISW